MSHPGRRRRSDAGATVAILGAGPAGLTAAYELQKRSASHQPMIFEADRLVGGISRTESHKGYRFDIGGHRFFTKVAEVEELWHEILGKEFITVERQSRIFYRGKFYNYPLRIMNALLNLGAYETFRIAASLMKWKLFPYADEENFRQWTVNRFGGRLYMHFFRTYTEKVWGITDTEIRADWAAQRIKDLSLLKVVSDALGVKNNSTSLIEEFQYPRLGPGMMWETAADKITRAGGTIEMETRVVKVRHGQGRVTSIDVAPADGGGSVRTVTADHYISSLALRDLIGMMNPPPPIEVLEAANRLRYRDFMIVTLVLDNADPFPDNWIYIHDSSVKVGRIQNFRAWSKDMVPRDDRSSIGMEYFCNHDDELWSMQDDDLIALAAKELADLGLVPADCVLDGAIIRQPKAYPVYDIEYKACLDVVRDWLSSLSNFQTVGRNGQHRYNNQDHSMLTAILAARNLLGEAHDIWNVNVERSYHEEMQVSRQRESVT